MSQSLSPPVVSARRDLFFLFSFLFFVFGVKFLNGPLVHWGLSGKHEWPCSVGRLHRKQAQKTHTLIRFSKASGGRWVSECIQTMYVILQNNGSIIKQPV